MEELLKAQVEKLAELNLQIIKYAKEDLDGAIESKKTIYVGTPQVIELANDIVRTINEINSCI